VRVFSLATVAAGLLLTPLASATATNFGRSAEIPLAREPASVLVGDPTQDGLPDIVTINAPGTSISVLPGLGDGSFERPVDYPVTGARSAALGDWDSDGLEDLAVATGTTITLFAGVDGGLERRASYPVPAPSALAAADLDDDGNLDVVAVSSTSANVSVLLGHGDGTFDQAIGYPVGSGSSSVVVTDLNGDGALDIVTAGSRPSILFGIGDGTFGQYTTDVIGRNATSLAAEDLDQDGDPDVVTVGPQQVGVLLNAGDGTFPQGLGYLGAGRPVGVAIGDVSGDESLDIVAANQGSNDISIFEGAGDGTFQVEPRVRVGRVPSAIASADLNLDGTGDVVVSNRGSKSVTILLNGVAAPQPTICLVPRVTHRTLAAARGLITRAHCKLAPVRRKYSNRVKRGRVISQGQVPGTRLREGARVSVLVSRGHKR
jgi:hypothetical protein